MICPEKTGHIAQQVFGAQAILELSLTKPLPVSDTNPMSIRYKLLEPVYAVSGILITRNRHDRWISRLLRCHNWDTAHATEA